MPAALRWSGITLTALLLLAWLVSGWFFLAVSRGTPSDKYTLALTEGGIAYLHNYRQDSRDNSLLPLTTPPPPLSWTMLRDSSPTWDWAFLSQTITTLAAGPNDLTRHIFLPLYPLILAIAAPTTLLCLAHRRAARRARINLCPKCSYPMSGLPPQTPCPECGATNTPPRTGSGST